MLKTGLVSVSFRKLAVREIVDLVARAGLDGIEWGGDIHVPHGDLARAREVRAMTRDAGLAVAAYGSYWRVGETHEFSFAHVLDTARELGAPLIRVWAGKLGSDGADAAHRARLVAESRAIADQAAAAGIGIAYEFHRNTLTDTTASTLDLIASVGHPNLRTYWQPPVGMTPENLLASLEAVVPHLANLHLFHWTADGARRPLAEGAPIIEPLLRRVRTLPGPERFALLEFVLGDAPEQFLADAATLRELVRGTPAHGKLGARAADAMTR